MIAPVRQATVVEASLKIEVTSRMYRLPPSLSLSLPPFVYVSSPVPLPPFRPRFLLQRWLL